jgi:hypothetical protein
MSETPDHPYFHPLDAPEKGHDYPDRYKPGSHWATDAAWEILDAVNPGAISPDVRAYLAGLIAGRLMCERAETIAATQETL